MATPTPQAQNSMCKLCTTRPADTKVYVDEVVASRTAHAWRTYTNHSLTMRGVETVCAQCAAQYDTSFTLRRNGRRMINWGLIVLVVGVLLFGLTWASTQGSLLELVIIAPTLIGIILLGVGLGLSVAGNRLKRPMTRHLAAQLRTGK